jgi:hypothetical protein
MGRAARALREGQDRHVRRHRAVDGQKVVEDLLVAGLVAFLDSRFGIPVERGLGRARLVNDGQQQQDEWDHREDLRETPPDMHRI